MAVYLNGTLQSSGVIQAGTTPVTAPLFINGQGGTSTNSFQSYVAEILVFNTGLSQSNRYLVEGYLAWKWGIQSLLPNTHPYYEATPSAGVTSAGDLTVDTAGNIQVAPNANFRILGPTEWRTNMTTVSDTSLTIPTPTVELPATNSAGLYTITNTGFNALTLPTYTSASPGLFWTLANATTSNLSIGVTYTSGSGLGSTIQIAPLSSVRIYWNGTAFTSISDQGPTGPTGMTGAASTVTGPTGFTGPLGPTGPAAAGGGGVSIAGYTGYGSIVTVGTGGTGLFGNSNASFDGSRLNVTGILNTNGNLVATGIGGLRAIPASTGNWTFVAPLRRVPSSLLTWATSSPGFIAEIDYSNGTVTQRATSQNWSCVATGNISNVMATVNGGQIWLSPTGTTWAATSSITANWSGIVGGFNFESLTFVACINGGRIYFTTNAGTTWALTNAPTAAWSAITGYTTTYYACAGGTVYWTTGTLSTSSWNIVSNIPAGLTFTSIGADDQGIIISASSKAVYWVRTVTGAAVWTLLPFSGTAVSDNVRPLFIANPGGFIWELPAPGTGTPANISNAAAWSQSAITDNWISVQGWSYNTASYNNNYTRMVAATSGGPIYYSFGNPLTVTSENNVGITAGDAVRIVSANALTLSNQNFGGIILQTPTTTGVGINTTTPATALDVNGGITIRNGYRPLYSNVASGTSLTVAANAYGMHFNITTTALSAITLPTIVWATDSNAYWVFRNNTSSYLPITFTYTGTYTTAPANPVVIPPANSVTMLMSFPGGTTSNYVLF